jgi:hypothetical protein
VACSPPTCDVTDRPLTTRPRIPAEAQRPPNPNTPRLFSSARTHLLGNTQAVQTPPPHTESDRIEIQTQFEPPEKLPSFRRAAA